MADALVSPAVGGTMYVLSGVAACYSIHRLRIDDNLNKKIPIMGVMGAFVFAAQMINFTIPGTGSSGHLCGGLMLSGILGPYAGFLSMIGVLFIQCLFFADGGLLALGGNIWNMAFYGCFIGTIIWKYIMRKGVSVKKIWLASIFGSVVTLQMGAFSVTAETMLSGVIELPFRTFIGVMLPIHLVIGIVEGMITGAVLSFVYEARPELIQGNMLTKKEPGLSYRKTIAIFICLFIIIGGGVSLLASSYPDGLEWSIEKITGNTEIESDNKSVYKTAEKLQDNVSVFPDYSFKTSKDTKNNEKLNSVQNQAGTSVSGLVGCGITVLLLGTIGYVVKAIRKKESSYE